MIVVNKNLCLTQAQHAHMKTTDGNGSEKNISKSTGETH